ncbi:BA75_02966T0 [Komagataella pastoris]|uniref:BA75_02966T0 n=1 Tax=Komagataella pastoris TaxID=4922 RepID=A0A1B2JD88_PICPA|nr:BA75_02966T0 [Komagataella pastoris]
MTDPTNRIACTCNLCIVFTLLFKRAAYGFSCRAACTLVFREASNSCNKRKWLKARDWFPWQEGSYYGICEGMFESRMSSVEKQPAEIIWEEKTVKELILPATTCTK